MNHYLLYPRTHRQTVFSGPSSVSAFTLIELLTVIAIIGILAAILIPVVGAARQSAHQSKNITVIRELGMACLVYANDNDGKLPATTYAGGGNLHTTGPWLNANSGPRRLLSTQWDGGTGNTDYLPGPDAFYGPFTPRLDEERAPNEFARHNSNTMIMGYIYYSLPAQDGGDPPRAGAGGGLWNDRLDNGDAHHATVIFSDMTTANLIDLSGFNGKLCTAVHLNGSVSTYTFEQMDKAASWVDRIRILSGVAGSYSHLQ